MAGVFKNALKGFEPKQRAVLQEVADRLSALLPGAHEAIAWGMPAFKSAGVSILCFQGFKNHNSVFPMSTLVAKELRKELEGYVTSKGTIQFDLHTPMPKPLLRKIIEIRIREINSSYPKKSGEYLHFYANGHLQSKGRYRGDQMHGKWSWYRKDGSLMRSGEFKDGEQAGTWVTYDRNGKAAKTTRF